MKTINNKLISINNNQSVMKNIKILIIILCSLSVAGCNDQQPMNPNTLLNIGYSEEFQMFWERLNYEYAFWDIDTTNWDSMYDIYKPKFDSLDNLIDRSSLDDDIAKKNYKTDSCAKEFYIQMTKNLIDGHFSLTFNDGTRFYPADTKNGPFDTPYLWNGYRQEFYNVCNKYLVDVKIYESPYNNFIAVSGNIPVENGGIIPYLFFSGFDFRGNDLFYGYYKMLTYMDSQDSRYVIRNFLDSINSSNVKGVIIDVRGNGGGSTSDMYYLMSKFLTSAAEYDTPYTRYKSGDGRLDFTPWAKDRGREKESQYFEFRKTRFEHPIVILTDINSASCSEWTTTQVKHLPNGYQVGKQTWGCYGPVYGINDGTPYYIHSGYNVLQRVRFASFQIKFASDGGKSPEGIGRVPDYEVSLDTNQYKARIDTQLDKAIEVIKSKQ
jgi:hypothetical protein